MDSLTCNQDITSLLLFTMISRIYIYIHTHRKTPPIDPNHPADHGFLIQPHWAHGSFVSLWLRHGVVNAHGPDVETCHGYDLLVVGWGWLSLVVVAKVWLSTPRNNWIQANYLHVLKATDMNHIQKRQLSIYWLDLTFSKSSGYGRLVYGILSHGWNVGKFQLQLVKSTKSIMIMMVNWSPYIPSSAVDNQLIMVI